MSRPAALEVPEAKHAGRRLQLDWTAAAQDLDAKGSPSSRNF